MNAPNPFPDCCPYCGAPVRTPSRLANRYPGDTLRLPVTYACNTSGHETGTIDYCTKTLPRDQMGRVQGQLRNW